MSALPMICSSASTTSTRMAPHSTADPRVGTVKRSLVRSSVAPRRRSWGSTSRTTKSMIIGSAMRKFDAQDHVSGK